MTRPSPARKFPIVDKVNLIEWMAVHRNISPLASRIGVILLKHVNRTTGEVYMSHRRLAEEAHCSERAAEKATSNLRRVHAFILVQRGDGRGHANKYRAVKQSPHAGSTFEDARKQPGVRTDEAESPNASSAKAERDDNKGRTGVRTNLCKQNLCKVQPIRDSISYLEQEGIQIPLVARRAFDEGGEDSTEKQSEAITRGETVKVEHGVSSTLEDLSNLEAGSVGPTGQKTEQEEGSLETARTEIEPAHKHSKESSNQESESTPVNADHVLPAKAAPVAAPPAPRSGSNHAPPTDDEFAELVRRFQSAGHDGRAILDTLGKDGKVGGCEIDALVWGLRTNALGLNWLASAATLADKLCKGQVSRPPAPLNGTAEHR